MKFELLPYGTNSGVSVLTMPGILGLNIRVIGHLQCILLLTVSKVYLLAAHNIIIIRNVQKAHGITIDYSHIYKIPEATQL